MRVLFLLLATLWLAPPALAQSKPLFVLTDGNGNRPSYTPLRLQQGRVVVDGDSASSGGSPTAGGGYVLTQIAHFAPASGSVLGPVAGVPYEAVCGGAGGCGDLNWSCGAADGCACAIVVSRGDVCSLPVVSAAELGGVVERKGPRKRPNRLTVYGWDPGSAEERSLGARRDHKLVGPSWVVEPGARGADFACRVAGGGQPCALGGLVVVRD